MSDYFSKRMANEYKLYEELCGAVPARPIFFRPSATISGKKEFKRDGDRLFIKYASQALIFMCFGLKKTPDQLPVWKLSDKLGLR